MLNKDWFLAPPNEMELRPSAAWTNIDFAYKQGKEAGGRK
jgi:hypothetical protein